MILLTGVAGFIGSHLAEKCKDRKIIGIDNFNDFYNPEIKRKNWAEVEKHGHVTLCEGDIRDKDFLNEIFSKYPITTVVHLAAMAGVRPSLKDPSLYEDVNIRGTLNILECMKEKGIKNYVFASSSSVYGEKKEAPFREDMVVDKPISFYAATKKAGEELNHVYSHLYGIKTANLRFFTVYGPRQRPDLAIHKFTRLIYEGQTVPIYGDGSFRRDFTYIDDILDGITKSIDWVEQSTKPVFETFNLGESNTITVNTMLELIEKSLKIDAKRDFQAQQPGDVPLTYADISKAKELIGYAPKTPIEEGIPKFIKWFLENEK